MNELSLFSGAGGGLLGTKLLGWRTVGYVENNLYCTKILRARIDDGILDEAPIFGDIDDFIESGAAKKYKGYVDVVTAGFPCQPFSVAGKKKGQDDERNKWPQTIQCIRDVGCRYALLENVPGLLNSGYFPEILRSLAEAGFDARWTVLGADDVGAPHRRKRLWILAHFNAGRIQPEEEVRTRRNTFDDGSPYVADSISKQNHRKRKSGESGRDSVGWHPETAQRNEREASTDSLNRLGEDVADSKRSGCGVQSGALAGKAGTLQAGGEQIQPGTEVGDSRSYVADSDPKRSQGQRPNNGQERWKVEGGPSGLRNGEKPRRQANRWPTEPDVGRVAHGVAHRMDMLKALGNGQVPRVFATAWRILNDANGAVIKKTPR